MISAEVSRKDAKNAKLRILSLAFFASLRETFSVRLCVSVFKVTTNHV